MIIKYYSAGSDKYIIERDLSKEKIIGWEVVNNLGYKCGNLMINFDTSQIRNVTNQGGIYPPISEIINYTEVVKYLNDNFLHFKK